MSAVERARVASTRHSNKFTFSDYRFARFVRERLYEILITFDANANREFEEDEIKKALVQIFNQKVDELFYVTKNMFRYDKNNDGRISYKEFIDFTAEQHFGELAIQRLHRIKTYSQGSKRIMNLAEFIKTLEYSLNKIGVEGPQQIYQILFQEVDLDGDGYISYEDYFVFLKEYFGSLSQIADEQPQQNEDKPLDFPIDNGAAERFAKLVYSQLKITVMQVDGNKRLYLQRSEIQYFLQELLQVTGDNNAYILNLIFQNKSALTYEEFLQFFVPFYFCEFYVSAVGLENSPINEQAFVQLATQASAAIVAVPPSQKTLRSIYYLATGEGSSQLDLEKYVMLMGNIFENFNFDKRGLAHELPRP